MHEKRVDGIGWWWGRQPKNDDGAAMTFVRSFCEAIAVFSPELEAHIDVGPCQATTIVLKFNAKVFNWGYTLFLIKAFAIAATGTATNVAAAQAATAAAAAAVAVSMFTFRLYSIRCVRAFFSLFSSFFYFVCSHFRSF